MPSVHDAKRLFSFLDRRSRNTKLRRRTSEDRRLQRRRMLLESLENRHLLAGDIFSPGGQGTAGSLAGPLTMVADDSLQIDIGGTAAGTSYDQVIVGASAQFDGALSVQLIDGFDPAIGETFQVVSSVGSSGTFAQLDLPANLPDGKRFVPVFSPEGLTLVVADAERPSGGSQLRLPNNEAVNNVANFLSNQVPSFTEQLDINVFGQTLSGAFTLGAGFVSGAPAVIASVTDVSTSLGGDLVSVRNGSGSFFLMQSGVAGSASVDVSLKEDLDVDFSGSFGFAINTTTAAINSGSVNVPAGPYVRVSATDATLAAAGQSLEGSFQLESQTVIENTLPVKIVKASASGVTALLGTESAGVQLSNGQGGLIIRPTSDLSGAGIAAQFSGDVALVGISDELSLGGTVTVRINTTGIAVSETLAMSDGTQVVVDFRDTGTDQVVEFGGALDLSVANFLDVSGAFSIRTQSVVDGSPESLLVGISNVNAFFGDGGAPDSTGDDAGLRITGGTLGLLVDPTPDPTTENPDPPTPYALYAAGSAALVGFEGLQLAADMTVRKNTTGRKISQTAKTPNGSVAVTFVEGEETYESVSGSLTMDVGGFVSMAGGFNVKKVIEDPDGPEGPEMTTKLVVGAGVNAYFGENRGTDDAIGVEISDASLGMVLYRTTGSTDATKNGSSYALNATSGNIDLVGVDGLTLGGLLDVRVNNTGKIVNESITVPGFDDPQTVKFNRTLDTKYIGGVLALQIGDFNLGGNFSFEKRTESISQTKTNTTLLIGAKDVETFVGVSDGGDPLGLRLTGGTLGMQVIKTVDTMVTQPQPATYAVDARGTVALEGLPLIAGGTFGVLSNNTGRNIIQTIEVPDRDGEQNLAVSLDLPADQATKFLGRGVTLGVEDVFTIGGDFEVSRRNDGKLLVDIRGAALSLIADQQEVIRIGGGAAFTLGGDEGFKLESFTVGGSTFSTPGTTPTGQATNPSPADPAATPPSAAATTLGPLSIQNPSVSVSGFDLGRLDVANQKFPLSITVGVGIGAAELNLGNGAFTGSATNIAGSFGVDLELSTQAPFVSGLQTTGEWDLTVGSVTVGVGQFLEFNATGLKLDPAAGPDEDLLSFDSVSAKINVQNVDITGTASKFAVQGDGDFVAKDGFAVSLSMTDADPLGLSFLPIQVTEVKATWPGDNFNTAPENFLLSVSASIDGNFGPVAMSGSIDRMVIDVEKLSNRQFPIVDLEGFSAAASGNLFGGEINGGVIGGLVTEDANGNLLDEPVFYGGIIAGFNFAGTLGAEIRVGFSELGFLSGYLSTNTPAGLLLEPVSGLSIKNFRGGVAFNAAPLDPPSSPAGLNDAIFQPTTSLTLAQWETQLRQQVVIQATGSGVDSVTLENVERPIRIEAGGTLYSQYVSESVFKVDVDVIVTTDGRFVVSGKGIVGSGAIEADIKLYGDLSSLDDDQPERPLQLLFLADMNTPGSQFGADPLVRLEGEMTFAFKDINGDLINPALEDPDSFEFRVLGRGTLAPANFAKVIIGGDAETFDGAGGFAEIKLTVVDNDQVKRVALDFSGSLSIDGLIKADDLITAAGQLTIEKQADAALEIWGAAKLDFTTDNPGLSFLEEAGLAADASFLVGLNFGSEEKTVELSLPGRDPEAIVIAEDTVLFEAQGSLTFNKNSADILGENDKFNIGAYLEFDGAFSFVVSMNDNDPATVLDNSFDVELFVAARLSAGLTVVGNDLRVLEIDALGLVVVTNIGFNADLSPRIPTIGARLDLSVFYASQGVVYDLEKAQLLLNTTGQDVIYVVPERLQDRIANLQTRRDSRSPIRSKLPDAVPIDDQGDPLPTNQQGEPLDGNGDVLTEGYSLGFVIPGAPTDSNGAPLAAGPYVQLVLQGSITVAQAVRLEGGFRITVGAGGFELGIGARATLAVPAVDNLFSAQATGLLRITDQGLVGGIAIAADFSIPGIQLGANLNSYIGVNTTATPENLNSFQVPDGVSQILAPRSAIVYISGTLTAGER